MKTINLPVRTLSGLLIVAGLGAAGCTQRQSADLGEAELGGLTVTSNGVVVQTPQSETQQGQPVVDPGAAQVASDNSSNQSLSKYNLNKYTASKTVCDPFGETEPESPENGLKASLFYKGLTDPRYYSSSDYIDKTVKSTQSLFFTDVKVPTRMFNQGFPSQSGQMIKDDNGANLIEFFALKMESVVRLTAEDSEGLYEFASLADDGVTVRYRNTQGVWTNLISNEGDHPTRMGCSSVVINMTRDMEVPIELQYYQGPRYHISNMLMWRKLGPGELAGKDISCGKLGNNMYFDPNNGVPQKAYQDLLARGWAPLAPGNYFLGKTDEYNPCVVGTAPTISNLIVAAQSEDGATFTWNTDIPASSQVIIKIVSTGAEITTASDNVLRTEHSVTVTGLPLGVTFEVRAISISADLGKTVSEPIFINTN